MARLKQYAVRDAKYNTYFSGIDLEIAGFESKEKALDFAIKVKDMVGESRSVTVMDQPTASGHEKEALKQGMINQIVVVSDILNDIQKHKTKKNSDQSYETFWFYNGDLNSHYENFRKLEVFLGKTLLEIHEDR